jgi:putative ABC transport system permease protein
MAQTLNEVEKGFKEVLPDYGFSFQFYDDYLDSMYQQEEKRADSIRVIAIIAILISCIGLIGLVEFSTKRRIKEIGIRKVNGAKVSEILLMLNKDFVKWVVVAFVIATPIAYYAMNKWLESFAYKTELSWWIFALAGLLALGIALLTVSWQSWRAATRNPVEALRYE